MIRTLHIEYRRNCEQFFMRAITTDVAGGVVCLCLCDCLLITTVSPAKTAESTEMPSEIRLA